MNYDYNYFDKLIKEKQNIKSQDLSYFVKLPQHQKEQLIKSACVHEQLEIAKALEKKTFSNGILMGKILTDILANTPQEKVDTLEWLFSFGQLPDIEKSLYNIFRNYDDHVLDCIFSRCPLSPKKIYNVISFSLKENYPKALEWILDRQHKKYIPFENDMFYWGIYQAYKLDPSKGKLFVDRLVTFMPEEMVKIKEKMNQNNYVLPNYSNLIIYNNGSFQAYVNNLETVALQFKLEHTLKKDDKVYQKKLKV